VQIDDVGSLSTPQLTGLMSRISAELTARLLSDSPPPAAPAPTWALTADEAARMLGKSRRWLFQHKHLPFIRPITRKTLVCDEARLKHWVATRR
jgi:hypothetical protein